MSKRDYCECKDCESVLSPSAYLVDLLHNFLDSAPAKPVLYSVLGILVSRRPDLLFLKLNCDNAELPIPYLDLVNEVLEACILYKNSLPNEPNPPFTPVPKPNDTSAGAAAEELAVSPENTNPHAYIPLLQAVYPHTLPFNLWLETVRACLQALGTSCEELLATFASGGADVALACETLGISAEEHAILSTANAAGNPIADPHPAEDYYGVPSTPYWPLYAAMHQVTDFLRFAGLEYQELLRLFQTRHVNPPNVAPDVRILVETNDPCSVDAAVVRNLGSVEPLARIHRFLRLWRKLGCDMLDLDRMLQALGAKDVDDGLLLKLAAAQQVAQRLHLPQVKLLSFWSPLDTYRYGDELDPYSALFQNKSAAHPDDPCFALTVPPAMPELAGEPGCTMTIAAHLPAIQAALRLRAADLATLAAAVIPDNQLNLANLSALHRHALLASSLRRPVAELLSLITFFGGDPFITPQATLTFLQFCDAVHSAGFTLADLDLVYRDRGPAGTSLPPTPDAIARLLGVLCEGLARIEADHRLAADPNGELTRQKLMVLYEPTTADAIVGLIQGTSVWQTPLAMMPALAISDELRGKLLYQPASKSLQFSGVMTDTERAQLSSGQAAVFQAAVQLLWEQPRTLVESTLANFPPSAPDEVTIAFLDPTAAKNTLLNPSTPTEKKFAFVLAPLLRHLTATLSRDLVTQTLASAFNLEPALTRWMLDKGLASRAQAAKPAMTDFLQPLGVDARFLGGKDLAGPAVVSASSQISVDWGAGSPAPSIPHAGFSAQWTGLIRVPESQTYTLHVLANDGVRLWLDGRLLIDDWNDQPATERSAVVELKAGQLYELTLHHYQATAAAPAVHLSWSSPTLAKAVIPSSALHPLDPWRLFHKAAMLVGTFRLTVPELEYLAAHAADFGNFNLNQLPLHPSAFDASVFASWDRLRGVAALRAQLTSPTVSIADVLGAPTRAEAITKLSTAADWDAQDLDWLAGPSAMNLSDADFRTETALLRIATCFTLSRRTGIPVRQLRRWAFANLAGADGPVVAIEMQKALKSVHDAATWVTVGKALNDGLREARRNALVDYLLAHPDLVRPEDTDRFNPLLKTADDLYEYLLIDVQMDACMMTSRIMQAISSVQLFVQRCLLGLEPDVDPGALSAEHWTRSMQHYRVWEAARKVFMYPENWIQPQLRDDKTPFFRELETDLLKNELSTENVEAAYTRYLRKLEDIARPEILGLCIEDRDDPDTQRSSRIVHVIGRTRSTPHQHYYRSQIDGARWNAWEPVALDIEGNCALPVVWERRLYFFWPLLAEKALPTQASSGPAATYWEIRFAFSEYVNGKWAPKRVLDKTVALQFSPKKWLLESGLTASNFSFKAIGLNDKLVLQVLVQVQEHPAANFKRVVVHELAAAVDVSVCDGETRIGYPSGAIATAAVWLSGEHGPDDTGEMANLVVPASTDWELLDHRFTAWSWHGAPGGLRVAFGFWEDYGSEMIAQGLTVRSELLLEFAPAEYEIVVPHQFRQFDQQASYFYQDRERTYFVEPRKSLVSTPLGNVYSLETRFFSHYHPFVCHFLTQLHRLGLDGLLSLQTQAVREWAPGAEFGVYQPAVGTVMHPYPESQVAFESDAAYAIYNWELFFYAPFLIACKLSEDQRFAEAHRWFHYIFNPTRRADDPAPQRFWNFAPFYLNDPNDPQSASIQKLLLALGDPNNSPVGQQVRDQLHEWADDPFNPHLVARMRPVAYQNAVVMRYIDNLVAWADQLFTRGTIESINEATQLYVLALKMLGDKPRALPPIAKLPPLMYAQLGSIDEFANALEDLLMFADPPTGGGAVNSGLTGGLGVNLLPYFCVPPNPKLLGYWDTIADRLFKIRHCMNIQGVVRKLPLFEPPIEPGLLVRATAQGVDISSVLSDLNSPLPYYRFTTVLRQALDLCAQLRGLGSALLAALEKQDAEALAALRVIHETALLTLVKDVKKNQLLEAQRVREGLDKTWELTEFRRHFWETQLSENGSGLTAHEQEQQRLLDEAQDWQAASQVVETAAGVAFQFPDFTWGTAGSMGSPVVTARLGGSTAGASLHAAANVLNYISSVHTYWASEAGTQATWERRARDWLLQMQTAAKELEQIEKQKLAADIRIDIATQEIANHDRQLENAREIEAFYRDKYTSVELYEWMSSELSALYFRSYQIAYGVAKRAERAYRFERGLSDSNFVQFGYWDSMKKGLLAGERLELALRKMESAYLEQNQREYEITKHVSLQLLDPIALIALKQAGLCEVVLPESLFDADYPGHYMRRLKSASLTLPCVVGPYTSINCTLTLLNNKTRVVSTPATPYEESADSNDARFVSNFAAIQSIATSHGQNDSGLFELNFRDERYLPFEGAGAVSRWRIELPQETNAFDLNSLSDVVLHLKYTAREGGSLLRDAALTAMRPAMTGNSNAPLMRLISVRHEYPDAWHRFGHPANASATSQQLELDLSLERFPYQLKGKKLIASQLSAFLIFKDPVKGIKDYKSGGELRFTITPDGAPAWPSDEFTSTTAVLRGTPRTQIDITSGLPLPARLLLEVTEQDVQLLAPVLRHQVPPTPAGRMRLRTNLLDDLVLVVHYAGN
ncbi:neuraminidase-like domain-containing protein [Cupriavidus necator]|uniref:Tc toxin subunit A-related protein n=1 Tax=Cupriavidus necator TaxID=106590 RepID=UPI0039C41E17